MSLILSLILLLSCHILLLSVLKCDYVTVHVPRIPFTVLPEQRTLTSVLNPAEKERNHISAEQQSGLFDGRKRD